MGVEELRRFRRLHSATAGLPAFGAHPAIETSVGPAGTGFAHAVGMALGERMLAARFGRSLVDHRAWVIAAESDLMAGLSHEAASLAGHLRLGKLTVLYDQNDMSVDGPLSLASSDDPLRRFTACGWAVRAVDGHEPSEIASALSFAIRSARPTLIACRTIMGFAAPTRAGSPDMHRAPLGPGEAQRTKAALGCDLLPFELPEDVARAWRDAGRTGAIARRAWLKRLARHPQRAEFDRAMAGRLPEGWHEGLAALKTRLVGSRPVMATRDASLQALKALAPQIPELCGGSADRSAASRTLVPSLGSVGPGAFAGRHIHFGAREHGMAAALNGLALHGGFLPFGGTFLAFTDCLRPALRLAAIMGQRVIHLATHDGFGLNEDGATCQPVEQLAALRAMPGLFVFRPADAVETIECWELALRRTEGPSLLALTRQKVPPLRAGTAENRAARGGYVLEEASGPRRATLIASGSEVAIALAARALLAAEGIGAAVVSLPCWELFSLQDEAWRAAVLGAVPRFGVEAAGGFGWERWLGSAGVFIGMPGFGASGRRDELYRYFGITPEAIVSAVRKRLG